LFTWAKNYLSYVRIIIDIFERYWADNRNGFFPEGIRQSLFQTRLLIKLLIGFGTGQRFQKNATIVWIGFATGYL
jgi:hypothetical protein